MEKAALEAVRQGTLREKDIDASVERILRLADRSAEQKKRASVDTDAHDALACTVAEQGAVLLKNEGSLLPAEPADMVLIGHMAKNFRYQGSGSSHINPTKLTSLTDALPGTPYVSCCDSNGAVTDEGLRQAAELAKRAKIAVVVAGLPDSYESEGFDRESMAMPEGHNRMIEAVAAVNPNTVVVLLGGSPMELPWYDKVKAILYMGLSGQAGGRACANLLTGKANPCGKLTETWPFWYTEVVSGKTFGKKNVEYRESIYVGYRYYDKARKSVRFPFGHGLSYTQFSYSDLKIEGDTVSTVISNTGKLAGAEVVQLYVAPPAGGIHRPEKELKKGQFTLDNTCLEMKDSSLVMKIQYKVTEGIIAKSFGGKKNYSDPAFKMMMICATDCPLRASVISAGGSMADQLAQGLLEMANGHMFRGIRAMLKK